MQRLRNLVKRVFMEDIALLRHLPVVSPIGVDLAYQREVHLPHEGA